MAESVVRQRLAAILAADVAGYSRLMGDDERATIDAINQCRAVFREHIEANGGRVVDMAGDSVLAIFDTAIGAFTTAMAAQERLGDLNTDIPENRRMAWRVGVNLGDIHEQDDGTVYGDGVNVAARLEGLAEPGGICVSDKVHAEVRSKTDRGFADLGEHDVKNIAEPVRAYLVLAEGEAAPRRTQPLRLAALTAAVIAVGAFAAWQGGLVGTGTEERVKDPLLEMPTGPTVAVLPFDNLSGDAEQDYFSDGLTEDLITELARVRDIRVLARNTTFQYKGQAVDVQAVGRELGADYVIEGSVRRIEERLRINAQLVNVADGAHAWAERYDRPLADVFDVQDELIEQIVAKVAGGQGAIHLSEIERAVRNPGAEYAAYEHVLRARAIFSSNWRPDAYREAVGLLREATDLAPDYARAYQELAYTVLIGWIVRFDGSPAPPEEIKTMAVRAVELDPADPLAQRTAAYGYFFDKQLDRFEQHAAEALRLAPYDPELLVMLGSITAYSGDWERGNLMLEKAWGLNPVLSAGWYHSTKFYYHYMREEYEEALDIVRQHPLKDFTENDIKFVAVYGKLGRPLEAREHWNAILEREGAWSAQRSIDVWQLWNFREQDIESLMEGHYAAGIPRPDTAETN